MYTLVKFLQRISVRFYKNETIRRLNGMIFRELNPKKDETTYIFRHSDLLGFTFIITLQKDEYMHDKIYKPFLSKVDRSKYYDHYAEYYFQDTSLLRTMIEIMS